MKKKVLVLGITGGLGHVLFDYLMHNSLFDVYGTTRTIVTEHKKFQSKIFDEVEIVKGESEKLKDIVYKLKPDIIVNCIGLIKQQKNAENIELSVFINSKFPKFLNEISEDVGSRLIHISSDCVFDGVKGNYTEDDIPNAKDIYGLTKKDGEIQDNKNTVTLRTSFIGHEISSNLSLLAWFLSQKKEISGYKKAYFSGTTTLELSKIISEYIIPNGKIFGIYHIGAERINKHDLLKLIKKIYKKDIDIEKNEKFIIDRSLNQEKFLKKTRYKHKSWEILIQEQYKYYQEMLLKGYYARI